MTTKPFGLPGIFTVPGYGPTQLPQPGGGYPGLKAGTLPQPTKLPIWGWQPERVAGIARGQEPGPAGYGASAGLNAPYPGQAGGDLGYGTDNWPPNFPEGFGLSPYTSPIPGPPDLPEGMQMPNAAPPMAYNPYVPGGLPDGGYGRTSAPGLSPVFYEGPSPNFPSAVANAGYHYRFPKATDAPWYGKDPQEGFAALRPQGGPPEDFWEEFDKRYGDALNKNSKPDPFDPNDQGNH